MHAHAPNHRNVSKIIADLAGEPKDRVAIEDLLSVLGERSFGVLMLLLSLPNAVGLGTIPGLSTVFGVPQILIAGQMILHAERPWLPRFIRTKSIAMSDFRTMVTKATPVLVKVERLLRPRFRFMTSPVAERLFGAVLLVLAVVVSLPIPFANQPPAVAQAVIALAIIERDGLFALIGLAASAVAVAVATAVGSGILAGLYFAITHLFGL